MRASLMMAETERKALKINHVTGSAMAGLDLWYQTPLGCRIGDQVRLALDDFMATSFGYYAISIGVNPSVSNLMENCRTRFQFHLGYECQLPDVLIEPESLPVATDSTDLVVLNHALSQAADPHAILREVNRVLIPDGKLVIIDFNPVSLWGLRHLFQGWREKAPWGGHYYSAHRLKDWASVLGFGLQRQACRGHLLPFNLRRLIEKSGFLEKFTRRWLGFSGAVNILVFEKHTIPMTPYKPRWVGKKILPPSVARPSVGRGMKCDR